MLLRILIDFHITLSFLRENTPNLNVKENSTEKVGNHSTKPISTCLNSIRKTQITSSRVMVSALERMKLQKKNLVDHNLLKVMRIL
jgi:hypothetical protein